MGKKRVRDGGEEEEPAKSTKNDDKKTRVANFSELSLERLLERERELANEVRERQQELSDTRRAKAILYGNSEARQMNTRRHRAEYAHAEVQSEIQRRYRAMEESKQAQAQVARDKQEKAEAQRRKAEERAAQAAMQAAAIAAATASMPAAVQYEFAPSLMPAEFLTAGMAAQLSAAAMAAQLAPMGMAAQLSQAGMAAQLAPMGMAAQLSQPGMAAQLASVGMPGTGMGGPATAPALMPFMPGRVPDGALNLGGVPSSAHSRAGAWPQQVAATMATVPAALRRIMPSTGMLGASGLGTMDGSAGGMPLAFMRR